MSIKKDDDKLHFSKFEGWNQKLASAIDNIQHEDHFPEALKSALKLITSFDMFNAFGYSPNKPPVDIYNKEPHLHKKIIVEQYLSGAYLLDPFYEAVKLKTDNSFLIMQEIKPDHFYDSEYYQAHYRKTKIIDEVGYVIKLKKDFTVILSLSRFDESRMFNADEITALRKTVSVVIALCKIHWQNLSYDNQHDTVIEKQANKNMEISEVLQSDPGKKLTTQESKVVTMILQGHSSFSISEHLNINVTTVKTHRRNIYQKLNISSQAELFAKFINNL